MLRLFALLLFLLPCATQADLTIVTPSGYTMPSGFDGQLFRTVNHSPESVALLDAGTNNIQLETAYLSRPGVNRLALSLQALVLPETFVTPALSFGVKDIANSAGTFAGDGFYGRAYYFAATKDFDNGVSQPKLRGLTITAGLGAGSYHGVFGGVGVDLPLRLLGTAEYDGRSMNYRVAFPIAPIARISYARISNANYVALDIHSPLSL